MQLRLRNVEKKIAYSIVVVFLELNSVYEPGTQINLASTMD